MVEIFKTKIRKIGTSAGVLIPNEKLIKANVAIGENIELAILPVNRNFSCFGIAKHFKVNFRRDKKSRKL